jgi:hypothetical protein
MSLSEGLLKVKLNTTSDPSVAEAGEIVATVAALLSIMVPVAETVPEAMLKVFVPHQLYPRLFDTDTVPVVTVQARRLVGCVSHFSTISQYKGINIRRVARY